MLHAPLQWIIWNINQSLRTQKALTSELLGVFCEDFGENWSRYNGTALYNTLCHAARHWRLLTHWGREEMAAIFQTTLSNWFSWKKKYELRFKFHGTRQAIIWTKYGEFNDAYMRLPASMSEIMTRILNPYETRHSSPMTFIDGTRIYRCIGRSVDVSVCRRFDCGQYSVAKYLIQGVYLTHWGQVTQICVTKLDHPGLRQWLVAWSAPSHYLNQRWNTVNWRSLGKKISFVSASMC